MINVNVKENKINKEITLYPCIGQFKGGKLIVLFTKKANGIVLTTDKGNTNMKFDWNIGDTDNNFNMQEFELFDGTIELSNYK